MIRLNDSRISAVTVCTAEYAPRSEEAFGPTPPCPVTILTFHTLLNKDRWRRCLPCRRAGSLWGHEGLHHRWALPGLLLWVLGSGVGDFAVGAIEKVRTPLLVLGLRPARRQAIEQAHRAATLRPARQRRQAEVDTRAALRVVGFTCSEEAPSVTIPYMRPSEGSARDGPVVARLVVNPCGFLQPVLLAPAQPFALRVVTGRFSSRVTKTPLRLFPRRAFSTLSAEPCPASTTELRQRLAGAPCGASLPCLSGLGAWAGAILVLFFFFSWVLSSTLPSFCVLAQAAPAPTPPSFSLCPLACTRTRRSSRRGERLLRATPPP